MFCDRFKKDIKTDEMKIDHLMLISDLVAYGQNESTFLDTIDVYWWQIEELRNWGIEGLKDKVDK